MSLTLFSARPILTYFNLPNKGRGELIRLFFAEAEIAYQDNRVERSDWPAKKQELIETGVNTFGAMPVLQIGDLVLTQHLPILRYLSKKIGKYGGANDEEAFKVDQVSDVYVDWRFSWAKDAAGHPAAIPRFYSTIEKLLGSGPFVLGNELSYADIAVYQLLHDDGSLGNVERLLPYPNMRKFVAAFESRPRIAAYLEERKKNL
ncbi:putative glutathione S-transferase [Obelidium mucronatum]|nr:putative glutathione S-transferase [Obelidium mucronatum]